MIEAVVLINHSANSLAPGIRENTDCSIVVFYVNLMHYLIDKRAIMPLGSVSEATVNEDEDEPIIKHLEVLSSNSRFKLLTAKERDGVSLLQRVKNNPLLLKELLKRLPENLRLDAINETDNNGDPLLHSLNCTESIEVILSSLPNDEARLAAISKTNEKGQPVLIWYGDDTEYVTTTLCSLSSPDVQLSALKALNSENLTVLRVMFESRQMIFHAIMGLLPPEKRLAVLIEKYDFGQNIIHHLLEYRCVDYIENIFNLLNQDDLETLFENQNQYGRTPLHVTCVARPDVFKLILNRIPRDKYFHFFKLKDVYGHSVLQISSNEPESLRYILTHLTNPNRLELLLQKDNENLAFFHSLPRVAGEKRLKWLLQLLPENERIKVLMDKGKDGKNAGHFAALAHPVILTQYMFPNMTQPEILKLLKSKDDANKSVLEYMTMFKNGLHVGYFFLEDIFEFHKKAPCLSKDSCQDLLLHFLKEKFEGGNTLLHCTEERYFNSYSYKKVVSYYPSKELLYQTIKQKNDKGETVLLSWYKYNSYSEYKHPSCIEKLFELFEKAEGHFFKLLTYIEIFNDQYSISKKTSFFNQKMDLADSGLFDQLLQFKNPSDIAVEFFNYLNKKSDSVYKKELISYLVGIYDRKHKVYDYIRTSQKNNPEKTQLQIQIDFLINKLEGLGLCDPYIQPTMSQPS